MLNRYSRAVTQDPTQPAARAMLHAVGLTKEDLAKAQVGIVSTGFEGNPCNMHLNDLARRVKAGVASQDLCGLIFNTIGVSDGISMGTPGMRYSLPSREVIADSIETVVSAQSYDAILAVVGCDKNIPGALIGMSRLNRSSLVVYGGSTASGELRGRRLNIVSAFEALGEKLAGKISNEDYEAIVERACPGAGACGGMYTANTMASATEALGMSLPYSSSNPATSEDKLAECDRAGQVMRLMLERDIRPRDIMTPAAFENAITLVIALGGSTNAVLHLLAVARTLGVPLCLEDFARLSDRTPVLGDLAPSGRFLMEDLHQAGGTPAVMKLLLDAGRLNGSCLTVTGNTIEENLRDLPGLRVGQQVIRPLDNPAKSTGALRVLRGNLAPEGAIAKISGHEGLRFDGTARIYDSEYAANDAISRGEVKKGEVLVIRYEGPKGGPGMPEMLKPTSAIVGAGLSQDVALITDGRFSGGTHGFVVGHITPEAQDGGPIALLRDGDRISIDSERNTIEAHVSEEEFAVRRANWTPPALKVGSGALYRFARTVSSASEGCTTDRF